MKIMMIIAGLCMALSGCVGFSWTSRIDDLLNASIKLDGKECKTPVGEWDRNQKDVECVSFDGVEAKKSVDRIQLKDCALSIKGNHGLVFSKDGVFPIDDRWRGQVIEFSVESQFFGWGIKDVVEKCKGKTFRVAIDGEIAPSRSQSAMGGARPAAASERSR